MDLVSNNQQDQSRAEDRIVVTKTQATEELAQEQDVGKTSSARKLEEIHAGPEKLDRSKDPSRVDAVEKQPRSETVTTEKNIPAEHLKETRTIESRTIETSVDVNKTIEQSTVKEKGELSKGDKENDKGVAPRDTPITNKHLSVSGSGETKSKDTPSKFLCDGAVFHPSFDTKDALAYLESPAGAHPKKRHVRKSSLVRLH